MTSPSSPPRLSARSHGISVPANARPQQLSAILHGFGGSPGAGVGPRAWRSRGPSDHADTQLVGHSCAWALAQAAEQNTTPVVRCWFFRLRPDWRTNRDWHVSLTQTRTGRPSR
jgi:hypothetical protein